jgi:hypothetical protein
MPQELNTKMVEPLKNKNEVRPFDTVTIYWTDKAKHVKAGASEDVHPELAKNLIESGKATDKAPKAK